MPQAVRAHGGMHLRGPACEVTPQISANMAGNSLFPGQTPSGHGPPDLSTNTYFPSMVVETTSHVKGGPLHGPMADVVASVRCFRARVEELALHTNVRELRVICLACEVYKY